MCVFIIAQSRGKTTKQVVKGKLHAEGHSRLIVHGKISQYARHLENLHKPC